MKKYACYLLMLQLLAFSCSKNNTDPTSPNPPPPPPPPPPTGGEPPPDTPFVSFNKVFGGSKYDAFTAAVPAVDGNGYVLTGISESNDGDVGESHGFHDLWLTKIDKSGKVVWSKTYGGSEDEFTGFGLVAVSDGYIFAGATTSTDGNVTITKDDFRQHWLIKADTTGNVVWQKKFSNYVGAQIFCLMKTKNGDLVGGGFVADPGQPGDAWLFRLTPNGDLLWEKKFDDLTQSISRVSESGNGDIVAGGMTVESANPGQVDALLLRTSSDGTLYWQKSFGGSLHENIGGILATKDGGALLTTISVSTDGIATGNHGNNDLIIVKVDEYGNTEWHKVYGGTGEEMQTPAMLEPEVNEYMVTISTASPDGDFPETNGQSAWILTLNNDGSIVKKKGFGAEGVDVIYQLLDLGESKILVAGTTTAKSIFQDPHGGYEGWVTTFE